MSKAHWHVLGAGAMGCLMSVRLSAAQAAVTVLQPEGNTTSPLRLMLEEEGASTEITLPGSAADAKPKISHLLVTTKAYDVDRAIRSIIHRLSPQSQVLLMVNGLGYAQSLLEDFPWLQLFYGTTTEGAYRIKPLHVRHAGTGQTRLGRPGQTAPPPWMEQWQRALPECAWEQDIERALWLKLAINCAINPLTALHDCRNGALAQQQELAREVAELCTEIAEVSDARGYPDLAAQLHQRVTAVIDGTAENHSSMLQDVRAGRKTEIDYITGHLLRTAAQYHIELPRNRALLEEVKTLGY